MDLVITTRVVTNHYANLNFLLKVFQRVWMKKNGIEIKVLDHITFLFYIEEVDDMVLVLQKGP